MWRLSSKLRTTSGIPTPSRSTITLTVPATKATSSLLPKARRALHVQLQVRCCCSLPKPHVLFCFCKFSKLYAWSKLVLLHASKRIPINLKDAPHLGLGKTVLRPLWVTGGFHVPLFHDPVVLIANCTQDSQAVYKAGPHSYHGSSTPYY